MSTFVLDQLQYADDPGAGPWGLYIFEPNGSSFYAPPRWFRARPKHGDEITSANANLLCRTASLEGREVRITDGGDLLVFHAKGFRVLFGEDFWTQPEVWI